MKTGHITIVSVDHSDLQHCQDLHRLLVEYADFETGGHPHVDAEGLKEIPGLLLQIPNAGSASQRLCLQRLNNSRSIITAAN